MQDTESACLRPQQKKNIGVLLYEKRVSVYGIIQIF